MCSDRYPQPETKLVKADSIELIAAKLFAYGLDCYLAL